MSKRIRWTPPQTEQKYDLFCFTIQRAEDGSFVAEQVPDRPPAMTEANESYLVIDQACAISICWLDGKPAPETPERNAGLFAVMQHILKRLRDDDQAKQLSFGVGHAFGAQVRFDEEGK